MSYVQWHGHTWPLSDDEASLIVHLPPRDCPAALPEWDLSLDHCVRASQPEPDGRRKLVATLQVDVGHLGLRPRTWHDLSGAHLRADANWYEQTSHFGAYGHHTSPRFNTFIWIKTGSAGASSLGTTGREHWAAVDFEVRFGQRDGLVFPCEIDAWLLPQEDFSRDEPESPEELAAFGQGPPNLRVITRAVFHSGTIDMPRCGDDPWPQARREIHAALGPFDIQRHEVKWDLHRAPGAERCSERPGWRSSIQFWTAR